MRNPKNRIPTDRAVGTNRRNDNKPRLFAGDVDTTTVTARGPKSFGQRLRTAGDGATRQSGKGKRDDSIVTMRRLEDGGMEMSFIPSANAGHGDDNIEGTDFIADGAGKKGKGDVKKGERKVERFGAGLEKGGLAAGDRELTEAERSGRQKRRHPGRSASKNVFRGM